MEMCRHLGNILWIWLSVMWGCPDIWATSCGSGCLLCGWVQTFGQHPVDLVVCYVVGSRHLGNILWIWLSVMWLGPDIWATSCGSGCLLCGGVQTFGQHPVDLVVSDVEMCRHMGNILWIWLSVMWRCVDIWATSCGSGGQ